MSESSRIAIVTDSTADLPDEVREAANITRVPLNLHFADTTYLDQVSITTDEFMDLMTSTSHLPTTSQPSVGAFEEVFMSLAETHDAIVCVLITSRLSGTVQSAQLAANAVSNQIRVEVVDSLNATASLGFQAVRASELAKAGRSVDEIATILRAEVTLYDTLFFVETLEHLRRGGRIGKAAQLLGSLLQLKPLLRIDEGQVVPFERSRTRSRAIGSLKQFAENLASIDQIVVLYNTTPDDAATLARDLETALGIAQIDVRQISPVLGTHVGPDVLGLAIKEEPSV